MSSERIFQIVFWLLFGGLFIIQIYFVSRFRQAGDKVSADQKASEREGLGKISIKIIASLALIGFLVLYALNPNWLTALSVPFPDWLRWLGIAFGCVSFMIYIWALATLGKEWSPNLQTRKNHQLVTTGPYARMRHPLYAAYILFMTSIALLTANCFFIALLVASIFVLVRRIPMEEQILIETFGEEYKTYMQKTRGLIPK